LPISLFNWQDAASMTGAQRISLADRRAYGRERRGSAPVVKKVDQGPLILLAYLLYVEEELILTGYAPTSVSVPAPIERSASGAASSRTR
jgi:hypothetical protein